MAEQPWRLEEATLSDVRERRYEVAVLPFGATECHNLHLPYCTDTVEVTQLTDAACGFAWGKGARVALLPTVPFGCDRNMLGFPMVVNLDQKVLDRIVEGVVESMEAHGIRKMVVVNGHGGNQFTPCLRALHGRTQVFVALCDWWLMIHDVVVETCVLPEDHGGEMETSLMKLFAPDLVHPERADDGAVRQPRLQGLAKGWVKMARPWHLLTKNSGHGDPRLGTAEKGARLRDAVAERLGSFLVELAGAEMDGKFPY